MDRRAFLTSSAAAAVAASTNDAYALASAADLDALISAHVAAFDRYVAAVDFKDGAEEALRQSPENAALAAAFEASEKAIPDAMHAEWKALNDLVSYTPRDLGEVRRVARYLSDYPELGGCEPELIAFAHSIAAMEA